MRMVFYIDGMGGQNLGPNSGAHLLESNPSPIYHTMTLSTHVYLKKDAVVGIGFERTGDNSNSDWYVHTDTSFSAIRLGPKGHVGFHAGGTTNRNVAAGWHTGSDYSTDESQMGEYQFDSGHFDGVKFTAPVDGIYSVEAQQRHNGNGSNDAANARGYNSGIHTIRGNAPSTAFSLGVNGFMRLKKGDTIWQVFFAVSAVERGHENGFSVALVHPL
eukprot:gene19530-14942_t